MSLLCVSFCDISARFADAPRAPGRMTAAMEASPYVPDLAHGLPEFFDAEDDPDEPEKTRLAREEILSREVLIDFDAATKKDKRNPERRPVRIGVVCMTKQPACFETWLQHHVSIGAERIYLRVEDTPELEALLCQPPWDKVVKARFCRNTVRDWSGQTHRQVVFVDDAIDWARTDGVTHLLHCDDDELLHCPSGREAFVKELETLPLNIGNVHALTLEALVPSIDCTNPFAQARTFKHKPAAYSSYGSAKHNAGKSLGGELTNACFRCVWPTDRHSLCLHPRNYHHAPSSSIPGSPLLARSASLQEAALRRPSPF